VFTNVDTLCLRLYTLCKIGAENECNDPGCWQQHHQSQDCKQVIEAWVSKGYSLRHIIIEALIFYHNQDSQNSELEYILEKITHLLGTMTEGGGEINVVQGTLPEAFIGSISKSVKIGKSIE
jgi:hypothetical protein